jgi:hypothetical protein
MANDVSLRYSIPGDNTLSLTDGLASTIRKHFAADRENRFQLFLLASGIRRRYLKKKGKKEEYDDKFRDWYVKHNMETLFGQLANFTKYAMAGEVVAHTASRVKDPEKRLQQLPTSLRAMYAAAQLLQQDRNLYEVCLKIHPTRKSVDEPQTEWGAKDGGPLIHPHATSEEIDTFVERWFRTQQPAQSTVNKKEMVLLAKFYVSKDLFNFDKKSGKHLGKVDIKEVEELLGELQSRLPKGKAFAVEDDVSKIKRKYYKAKDSSGPEAKIRRKPSQRIVRSKKTSSAKTTSKT